MPRLQFDRETLDVTESEFLEMTSSLAEGAYNLAKILSGLHYGGFCDVSGEMTQPPEKRTRERISQLIDYIDDGQLRAALKYLQDLMDKLRGHDSKIVEWLAMYTGSGPVLSLQDRVRLKQRLDRITDRGPDEPPQGPIWRTDSKYQILVQESQSIMEQAEQAKQVIDLRLDLLQSQWNDE